MGSKFFVDDNGTEYRVDPKEKIIFYPYNKFENKTEAIKKAMSNGWRVQLQIT